MVDEINQLPHEEQAKEKTLDDIRLHLREKLPPNAIAPTEKTHLPSSGSFSGFTPQNTLHVDSFLYPNDDVIDENCDKGLLQRYYCKDCSSRNVAPLEFISHSMSVTEAKFIFTHILPNMAGKIVVDIGSRLGVVLYCGFLYSKTFTLYGLEFNKELADLQTEVVKKFAMGNRVKIRCDDVKNCADILKDADAVILNNVFDAFIEPQSKIHEIWEFVLNSVAKPGAMIIADPGLEEAMKNANVPQEVQTKLMANFAKVSIEEKLAEAAESEDDEAEEELSSICVYKRIK